MRVRALLAAAIASLIAVPAAARDLTIVARAGPFQAPLRQVFIAPFTAETGIPVDQQSWTGGLAAVADVAGWGTPWDLVQVTATELDTGCAQGLFEPLDWNALGGRERYLLQAESDCGVGAFVHSTVLTWERDKFHGTPSWADFWDVTKYPGKRGLRRDVKGNLEIALMADGVAPADVYSTLRSAEGVDRAFRRLDQLKPYLVFWTSKTDALAILLSGAVLMTSAPDYRVSAANRDEQRNLGIQWNGNLYQIDSWAMVAGTAKQAEANRFLRFYGTPAVQARMPGLIAYGPVAKGANALMPPELRATSPSLPANMANGLQIDEGFWRDNYAKLSQRFQEWLKH